MHWYFMENGQQVGPITDSDFQQRVKQGSIQPNTQVWNESMAGWQPYSAMAPAAVLPPQKRRPCSQCRREFSESDLIQYEGLRICADCKPLFFQRLREGALPSTAGIWRDQKNLVMDKTAQLPDRCVKCNEPAHGIRLKRVLYWHPPAWYLLLCVGVLFYAIAAVIVRKRAEVHVGICQRHLKNRRIGILTAWGLFAFSVLSFVIGVNQDLPALVLIGSLLFLASLIVGIVASQTVTAAKMNEQLVWIKGTHHSYLDQFPTYSGS